jgi:carbonic anhydrase/acetyltransferase-like protein (isoleucine patch superfamily)
MPVYSLGPKKPRIDPTVVLGPNAIVIGDVTVGPRTSLWPGSVLRGDYGHIRVGSDCSIQDNVVVHCSAENPAIIGRGVTVAHSAIVHACKIGDECLIGAGAIIFDGAKIGARSILGVGSVVLEGRTIPSRSVAVGTPAKPVRRVTLRDVRMLKNSYHAYVEMSKRYVSVGTFKTWRDLDIRNSQQMLE